MAPPLPKARPAHVWLVPFFARSSQSARRSLRVTKSGDDKHSGSVRPLSPSSLKPNFSKIRTIAPLLEFTIEHISATSVRANRWAICHPFMAVPRPVPHAAGLPTTVPVNILSERSPCMVKELRPMASPDLPSISQNSVRVGEVSAACQWLGDASRSGNGVKRHSVSSSNHPTAVGMSCNPRRRPMTASPILRGGS